MKVSYANLKSKIKDIEKEDKTFDFMGEEIKVLSYLPIEKKYDLIMITCQKALEDDIYNPLKLDMYFHLHLVYMYTNISFTDKQKEDEMKIYDTLKDSGLLDKILDVIEASEYDELYSYIEEISKLKTESKSNIMNAFKLMFQDLPNNAEEAANIVKEFNPEDYKAVLDFARASNAGQPIL